ncbi:hypothetical protein BC829DRAFT_386676 [Chytridium lagenaria]|nr:hypothetical protein BC829DRAFT_386676 [Chytridium lagenaria]
MTSTEESPIRLPPNPDNNDANDNGNEAVATVTQYIVVVENTQVPSKPSQHLVAYNPTGYGFNPNEDKLAVSHLTRARCMVHKTPPQTQTAKTTESAFYAVTLPIIFVTATVILCFSFCLCSVARHRLHAPTQLHANPNADTEKEKKKNITWTTPSVKTSSIGASPTRVTAGKESVKPATKISIVTDLKEEERKYGLQSPGGKKVPKRSSSIGNPYSPRRQTLTAVQLALTDSQKHKGKKSGLLGMITAGLGPQRQSSIKNISSPTQVYKGDQMIVNSTGQIVSQEQGKQSGLTISTTKEDEVEDGRSSTTSTSSSISTVSSGAPETEFRYDCIVPWIPQRFDELALAPGDSVIVYKVYEDGEGVFPMACLRGRTWSFFGVADVDVEEDEMTIAGVKDVDEPVDLSTEELGETYAIKPNQSGDAVVEGGPSGQLSEARLEMIKNEGSSAT